MIFIQSTFQRVSAFTTSTASPYFWVAFAALKNVHASWRWYRRIHLYTQQQSWIQLLAGAFVNMTIGNIPLLQKATSGFLVATRMLESTQAFVTTSRSYKDWKKVVKGEYISAVKLDWVVKSSSSFLSPSTEIAWRLRCAEVSERVEKIAIATWGLGSSITELCMKIMDVYDAIYPTEDVQNDANNEVFVNIGKWLDAAVENKTALSTALKNNEPVFNYVLQGTGIDFKISETFDAVMQNVESAHRTLGKIKYPLILIPIEIKK